MNAFRVPSLLEIEADWCEFTGGPPVIGVLGEYAPTDVEALVLEAACGHSVVSWAVRDGVAEVVSMHAQPRGAGLGRALLLEAERRIRQTGIGRVLLATTNDNVGALRFYLSEGYRLVFVDLDAMDHVRARKPGVPLIGEGGVPLRDMWHLEKDLDIPA